MKLNTLRIPCRDLARSETFYARCLGQKPAFGSVQDGYVGFQLDNVTVLLEPEEPGEFECGRYWALVFQYQT